MMEEQFMRGWTHSHERLSADLDRAFTGLGRLFRSFVDMVTPGHAPGEDSYFNGLTPARGTAKRAAPARIARRG